MVSCSSFGWKWFKCDFTRLSICISLLSAKCAQCLNCFQLCSKIHKLQWQEMVAFVIASGNVMISTFVKLKRPKWRTMLSNNNDKDTAYLPSIMFVLESRIWITLDIVEWRAVVPILMDLKYIESDCVVILILKMTNEAFHGFC